MSKQNTDTQRDFFISLNYASKYGACTPKDLPKARKEFGAFVDQKFATVGRLFQEAQ